MRARVAVADVAELPRARRLVDREVRAMDEARGGELPGVNASPGQWVEVSPLLFELVQVALAAARATGGNVDPAVGRALRVAGYDRGLADLPALRTGRVTFVPSPGWRLVQLDPSRHAVRVPRGVQLELDVLARALAADRGARACASELSGGVLVDVAGHIAVAGPPPKDGWPVRVVDDRSRGQTVSISDGGLATSRGESSWRSVSVAGASCVAASIASAAAVVRGASAPSWLGSLRLPARLVAADGEISRVANWPAAAA